MHTDIEELAAGLDLQLPALRESAQLSQGHVRDARTALEERLGGVLPEFDVLLYGSIAREEATPKSDFDFLVITFDLLPQQLSSQDLLHILDGVRKQLDLDPPGSSGLFGRLVAAQDVVETVGLEADTNFTHTRRILTLLESVSIYNMPRRRRLLEALVRRYLADHEEGNSKVPRFLLNDVLRYWRTIAVDYQAKIWEGQSEKWGSRYLKLIIARKVVIAGTIVSLFRCENDSASFLVNEFSKPPLARLAGLRYVIGEDAGSQQHLRTVYNVVDRFIGLMASDTFRQSIQRVNSRRDPNPPQDFTDMVAQATALQEALEALFFDTQLRQHSRKYLSY